MSGILQHTLSAVCLLSSVTSIISTLTISSALTSVLRRFPLLALGSVHFQRLQMCWLTAGWLAGWGRKEEERAGGLRPGSLSVGSCLASKAACCLWSRFQRMNLWSRVWDQNDSKRGADRREGDGRIELSIFSSSSRIMETGEPLAGGSPLPISWLQVSRLTKVHIVGPAKLPSDISCRFAYQYVCHGPLHSEEGGVPLNAKCSMIINTLWITLHRESVQ